jgi:alkanesulfonate monooxygenase SsuD/methylene tetrahydromethanopterin reductase-like flavin-dependent oxidoreductase (luciferase family)
MRIGLGPLPLEPGPGESHAEVHARALELAERAEALGLDAVWVDANHFTDVGHGPAPLLVAAALAARTERVAIGSATQTLALGEHPLHVATEALFLDALSGGRLVLGVGLGYREDEFAGFGVERADRRARFDEALAVLRAAFSHDPDYAEGATHFPVGAAVAPQPRPIRAGGPPVWVGGGWQPAAVRRVARLGLPLISQFFEGDEIVASKARVYREVAAPGCTGLATVPVIRDVLVGDPAALAKVLVPIYRRYAGWGMPLLGRPTRPDEIGPQEALRIAIVGRPSEVAERLRAVEASGATDLLARADLPGVPRAVVESTLETLAGLRGAACSRVESA